METPWKGMMAISVRCGACAGVGFLGAGVIWKGTVEAANGEKHHHVNGLTTAASIWLRCVPL
jgi:uncharacterized membrane protein YhiD involved in acid resistance